MRRFTRFLSASSSMETAVLMWRYPRSRTLNVSSPSVIGVAMLDTVIVPVAVAAAVPPLGTSVRYATSFAASSAALAPKKRRGRPPLSSSSSSCGSKAQKRGGGSSSKHKVVEQVEDFNIDEVIMREEEDADLMGDNDEEDLSRKYAGSEELLDSVGVSLQRGGKRRATGRQEEGDGDDEMEVDGDGDELGPGSGRRRRGKLSARDDEDEDEDLHVAEEEEGDEDSDRGGLLRDRDADQDGEDGDVDVDEVERRVQEGSRALIHLHPEIALEYDQAGNKKAPVPLDALSAHSPSLVWWQCRKCQHQWKAAVFVRCMLKAGCPVCKERENPTVASAHPELVPFWDPERNDPFMTLDQLPIDSKKSIVWRCPSCTHAYPARVKDQVVRNKVFCPQCGKDLHGEAPQRKIRKPRASRPKLRPIQVEEDPEVEARIAAAVEKIAAIRRAEREAAAAAAAAEKNPSS